MLCDGQKGVYLLRSRHRYALIPHLSCGFISPDMLKQISDVVQQYQLEAVKLTAEGKLVLLGIKEEDVDSIWEKLGCKKDSFDGLCIQSVFSCMGNRYCKEAMQNSLDFAIELDKTFYGKTTPSTCKIVIGGCIKDCPKAAFSDIGIIGSIRGWNVLVGGRSGSEPQISKKICSDVSTEAAKICLEKIINYYSDNACKHQRLSSFIDQIGFEKFKTVICE